MRSVQTKKYRHVAVVVRLEYQVAKPDRCCLSGDYRLDAKARGVKLILTLSQLTSHPVQSSKVQASRTDQVAQGGETLRPCASMPQRFARDQYLEH